MSDLYQFRREDNGEIVEVDWATMMEQDVAGYIELEDGVSARRINRPTQKASTGSASAIDPEMVSDNMGFVQQEYANREAHRKLHGFNSIEFRRDKQVPEFVQVVGHNRKEWERYKRLMHREDRNSLNGSAAILSGEMLEKTKKLVGRSA